MKTLVTGGTGFLGAHLVSGLARSARGAARDVRVLVQSAPPAWLRDARRRGVRGLGDRARRRRARARRRRARLPPGGHGLAQAQRRPPHVRRARRRHAHRVRGGGARGVKRIVMSSTSGTVAVSRRADEMPDEASPAPMEIIARWPYYASKLYQEEAARRACGDKVELVTVNPSLLLGPGDDRLSSTRPVLQFLAREIALIPPGGLNFVDARDVAALLPVAMDARRRRASATSSGGYNWTFAEFFGRLERLTKVAAPRLKSRGPLPRCSRRARRPRCTVTGGAGPRSSRRASRWPSTSGTSTRARRPASSASSRATPTDTLFDTVKYIREHLLAGRGRRGPRWSPAFFGGAASAPVGACAWPASWARRCGRAPPRGGAGAAGGRWSKRRTAAPVAPPTQARGDGKLPAEAAGSRGRSGDGRGGAASDDSERARRLRGAKKGERDRCKTYQPRRGREELRGGGGALWVSPSSSMGTRASASTGEATSFRAVAAVTDSRSRWVPS